MLFLQITKSVYFLILRLYVKFMRKIFLNILVAIISISFLGTINAEEKNLKETELNFFTGMFDFSDHKQKSGLLGLQHQNEDLFRNSFLGKLSPISGGFLTEKSAFYLYTGVQADYELGFLTITPSFAPGYYNTGGGKDLGYPLEFKSEVQMSFDLSDSSHLGISYNHISNASFGTKNPGANSYMFNFLKQF